ncbi:MAG: Sec-independent protein translocase protein TatB [Hyphomicrobiales bacterium]
MEFLGVGYQELLLILVLMLVVVGPERLPTMAYQIGRAVRTLQQYARAVRNEFSDEIEYLEEQYKTVKGEVDTARSTLREQQAEWERDLREATAVDLPPLIPAESSNGSHASESPPAAESAPADATPAATEAPAEPEKKDESQAGPPMVF